MLGRALGLCRAQLKVSDSPPPPPSFTLFRTLGGTLRNRQQPLVERQEGKGHSPTVGGAAVFLHTHRKGAALRSGGRRNKFINSSGALIQIVHFWHTVCMTSSPLWHKGRPFQFAFSAREFCGNYHRNGECELTGRECMVVGRLCWCEFQPKHASS